jgi:predicted metal-binding membrane protein
MRRSVEAALRRHRLVTILALALLVVLAWGWLVAGAGTGSPAGGMDGMAMPARGGLIVFSMWLVMMVAMMLPSAAPTILLYVRAAAHRAPANAPPPPTAAFLLGYLIVWGAFSAIAAALHLALEATGLLSMDTMGLTSRRLSGAVLIAAGVYQLTPLKGACLDKCRSPAEFLAYFYRPGPRGALRLGLIHGVYCLGCCWALMVLLFAGGVMNLVWIAVLTILVAAEKLLPWGRQFAIVAGTAMLAAGAALLLT